MTLLGNIESFDYRCDDICEYVERIEQYFCANDVNDQIKQTAIFLTVIGEETYSLLRKLLSPDVPASKSVKALSEKVKNHLQPQPIVIAERYKFYNRNQKEDETISDYIAELRKLTLNCDFQTFLDDALRDKFICGINKQDIRRRLLHQRTITLATAVQLAKLFEQEETNGENMNAKVIARNSCSQEEELSEKNECYRCNSQHHQADKCRFKNIKCHRCNIVGHLSKACRSKPHQPLNSWALKEEQKKENVTEQSESTLKQPDETEDIKYLLASSRAFKKSNCIESIKYHSGFSRVYKERNRIESRKYNLDSGFASKESNIIEDVKYSSNTTAFKQLGSTEDIKYNSDSSRACKESNITETIKCNADNSGAFKQLESTEDIKYNSDSSRACKESNITETIKCNADNSGAFKQLESTEDIKYNSDSSRACKESNITETIKCNADNSGAFKQLESTEDIKYNSDSSRACKESNITETIKCNADNSGAFQQLDSTEDIKYNSDSSRACKKSNITETIKCNADNSDAFKQLESTEDIKYNSDSSHACKEPNITETMKCNADNSGAFKQLESTEANSSEGTKYNPDRKFEYATDSRESLKYNSEIDRGYKEPCSTEVVEQEQYDIEGMKSNPEPNGKGCQKYSTYEQPKCTTGINYHSDIDRVYNGLNSTEGIECNAEDNTAIKEPNCSGNVIYHLDSNRAYQEPYKPEVIRYNPNSKESITFHSESTRAYKEPHNTEITKYNLDDKYVYKELENMNGVTSYSDSSVAFKGPHNIESIKYISDSSLNKEVSITEGIEYISESNRTHEEDSSTESMKYNSDSIFVYKEPNITEESINYLSDSSKINTKQSNTECIKFNPDSSHTYKKQSSTEGIQYTSDSIFAYKEPDITEESTQYLSDNSHAYLEPSSPEGMKYHTDSDLAYMGQNNTTNMSYHTDNNCIYREAISTEDIRYNGGNNCTFKDHFDIDHTVNMTAHINPYRSESVRYHTSCNGEKGEPNCSESMQYPTASVSAYEEQHKTENIKDHNIQYGEDPGNEKEEEEEEEVYYIRKLNNKKPMEVQIEIESQKIIFQIDTGTGISLISESTYRRYLFNHKLSNTDVVIKTYCEEFIQVLGKLNVMVVHNGHVYPKLRLYVVSGNGSSLLGRNWLSNITLDWKVLFSEYFQKNKNMLHQVN